jgi:hypothetical protein
MLLAQVVKEYGSVVNELAYGVVTALVMALAGLALWVRGRRRP